MYLLYLHSNPLNFITCLSHALVPFGNCQITERYGYMYCIPLTAANADLENKTIRLLSKSRLFLVTLTFLHVWVIWKLTPELEKRIQPLEMRCYHEVQNILEMYHMNKALRERFSQRMAQALIFISAPRSKSGNSGSLVTAHVLQAQKKLFNKKQR